MTTTEKNFQIVQVTGEEEYLVIHPETTAENVIVSEEGIEATDVGGALTEIVGKIKETGDAQVKRTEMGNPNGVATLDGTGKVPAAQLPGYVDDVESYANRAAFPEAGEDGKIYIDKETNKQYRWDGESDYVEISASLALGESASTAYAGNKGKANADAISALQAQVSDIESTNTEQDASIKKAQGDATANATEISNIKNGTTKVGKAADADNAANAESANAANKLAEAKNFSIAGDVKAEAMPFDGSDAVELTAVLSETGVQEGSYSAVTVDKKGRVTAGANVVEIGTAEKNTPSELLAVGGIFFKLLT